MRVFFDASVIIASLLSPTGGSALLFKYIRAEIIIGITTHTVIDEVLEEDKPKRLKKSLVELGEFIARSQLVVRERVTAQEIRPYGGNIDLEDAHLIAGAILTKCLYLVSFDKKHVMNPDVRRKFLPLQIVSPKELLGEIVNKK